MRLTDPEDGSQHSPAIWYDANGYQWGRIGPRGELLDQKGLPLHREHWVERWAPFLLLLALFLGATCTVWGYLL